MRHFIFRGCSWGIATGPDSGGDRPRFRPAPASPSPPKPEMSEMSEMFEQSEKSRNVRNDHSCIRPRRNDFSKQSICPHLLIPVFFCPHLLIHTETLIKTDPFKSELHFALYLSVLSIQITLKTSMKLQYLYRKPLLSAPITSVPTLSVPVYEYIYIFVHGDREGGDRCDGGR
jgi:hypothetical protein